MKVKGNHPLAEVIAKCMSGVNAVPPDYRNRMVSKACREAVKYHDDKILELKQHLADAVGALDEYGQHMLDCELGPPEFICTCGVKAKLQKYKEILKCF